MQLPQEPGAAAAAHGPQQSADLAAMHPERLADAFAALTDWDPIDEVSMAVEELWQIPPGTCQTPFSSRLLYCSMVVHSMEQCKQADL